MPKSQIQQLNRVVHLLFRFGRSRPLAAHRLSLRSLLRELRRRPDWRIIQVSDRETEMGGQEYWSQLPRYLGTSAHLTAGVSFSLSHLKTGPSRP
jgi:hypothetical protein